MQRVHAGSTPITFLMFNIRKIYKCRSPHSQIKREKPYHLLTDAGKHLMKFHTHSPFSINLIESKIAEPKPLHEMPVLRGEEMNL